VKYFAECADYKRLDQRTRHVRRLILEFTFEEPIAPGSPNFFGDMPLSKMTADAVEVLRDRESHASVGYRCVAVWELMFLINDLDRPFNDGGFGSKFRDWCDQAGLPLCIAHGVREAGAIIAAENGATTNNFRLGFDQASGNLHTSRRAKANGR
jgi:hypothetical protein